MYKDENTDYQLLKTIYDKFDLSIIDRNVVDRFELNLCKGWNSDTEIFIRKVHELYSFRVTGDGRFYNRFSNGEKKYNANELYEEILKIITPLKQ